MQLLEMVVVSLPSMEMGDQCEKPTISSPAPVPLSWPATAGRIRHGC